MVRFRRNHVPGGTYFFTVTLHDRKSRVLIDHIGLLRRAFREVLGAQPFQTDAIVVLPEHLHAVLTLPENDSATASIFGWAASGVSPTRPWCSAARGGADAALQTFGADEVAVTFR